MATDVDRIRGHFNKLIGRVRSNRIKALKTAAAPKQEQTQQAGGEPDRAADLPALEAMLNKG